ncbi:MAG: DNA-3-methyladenine glycosylase [Candidatus Bathyarchaeota archaeon]|nr:DNA-3-methyladenine glycosylase [Candidatus Termiticorpusculum sp.]
MILQKSFYQQDTIDVSKKLLGKILVHKTNEDITSGRIVETEAYLGPEDKAAHSSAGRRTARNEVMYEQKGHAYVYLIYGMYNCINVTAGSVAGKPEAVLIRALEPIEGMALMVKRRGALGKQLNLTNGPGRLCMAMGISRAQNALDLTVSSLYLENAPEVSAEAVVAAKRIGIDYAGNWKDMLWRFYIKNNPFVSKP